MEIPYQNLCFFFAHKKSNGKWKSPIKMHDFFRMEKNKWKWTSPIKIYDFLAHKKTTGK